MTLLGDAAVVGWARSLRGRPALPGDKSISHRALLLALLARGMSAVTNVSQSDDVRATRRLVEQLGARVAERPGRGAVPSLVVESAGIDGLRRPEAVLDCANAGTALRLTAGILAGQPFEAVLDGDASLRRRPLGRVIEPLRAMGAELTPSSPGTAPLRIRGRRDLAAIEWTPAVASAQVKSAILLAGLRAGGTTRVHEAVPTRDHTERLLRVRGVDIRTIEDAAGGTIVELPGGQAVRPADVIVPADASAAAFWLVAGAVHSDADLELLGVGMNPGRRGALDVLRAMGARIDVRPAGDGHGPVDEPMADRRGGAALGPGDAPTADLRVRSSELHGVDVDARQAVAAIDEIPVLCLAATQARGRTTFRGVGELRVKESDRIAGVLDGLSALGANVAVDGDDVQIVGPTALRGAAVDALGDHRLAMTFAVAGLLASGRTTITGAARAAISDPGFLAELERIRS